MTRDARVRVLTLICDLGPGFGGAERLTYEIVRRLDPERFRRYVCVTRAPPSEKREILAGTVAELEAGGVEVLRLDRRSTLDVLPWRALAGLVRREPIDVLHAHMFKSNLVAAVLGRFAGVPLVVAHEHSWAFEGHRLRLLLDREVVARGADLFLAVSRADARRMADVVGIPPERIRLLPNAVADPPAPIGADVRGELGIPHDAHVVGAVGVLRPEKGYDRLIDAIGLLREEGLDARLLIAGQGPLRAALEAHRDRRGLRDVVHLLGLRGDIPDVLAALDVAVMSSDREGMPLALLEYMAARRAIVATAVGGVAEILEDEVHALLVAPRDTHALATAIARLLRSPRLAARLGEAAQRRQRERAGMDAVVRELESLYLERLAGRPAARR